MQDDWNMYENKRKRPTPNIIRFCLQKPMTYATYYICTYMYCVIALAVHSKIQLGNESESINNPSNLNEMRHSNKSNGTLKKAFLQILISNKQRCCFGISNSLIHLSICQASSLERQDPNYSVYENICINTAHRLLAFTDLGFRHSVR